MENELRQRILKALSENVMIGGANAGGAVVGGASVGGASVGGRKPKMCKRTGYEPVCVPKNPKKPHYKLSKWQKCVKKYGGVKEAAKHYDKDNKICRLKKKDEMEEMDEEKKPKMKKSQKLSEEQKEKMRIGREEYLEKYNYLKELGYSPKEAREAMKTLKGNDIIMSGGRHGVGWRKFKNTMKDIVKIAPAVLPLIL